MEVRAYPDPELDLANIKSFDVVLLDSAQTLLEKQILFALKDSLVARGYSHVKDNPEFLVAISQYCGPFEEYVEPSVTYATSFVSGTTTTYEGQFGLKRYSGTTTTSGQVAVTPVVKGGGYRTQYFRSLSIFMMDLDGNRDSTTVPMIWEGHADSEGSTSDILLVAPYLISELLCEFPSRSGREAHREVRSYIGSKTK